MLWNEPNNRAHWDFALDPDWRIFARMVACAVQAIRAENPRLRIALGGISPIDPWYLRHLDGLGVIDEVDVVGVHGFPLDWNHWTVDEWPIKLNEVREAVNRTVWVTETGASSFGADEPQDIGLRRTAELLVNEVERVHWYTLFDLPTQWSAVAHEPDSQGAEYMRHFEMGLIRADGTEKPALRRFAELTPAMGICQWFHLDDPRLDAGVRWLRRLGVRHLRTGLNWADSVRPGAQQWFDRQMRAIDDFTTCITFCFTPQSHGIVPHHTSPPRDVHAYADFCGRMVRRYAV
ncbi:MAG: beta-xylosidase [Chitinivibrionales bacterium]|nr:beta-xylosidase [Chitinivibrionales bacterium]